MEREINENRLRKKMNLDRRVGFFVILLVAFSFSTSFVFAGSVTRDLPDLVSPGEQFTVTLSVDVDAGDQYYAIEERFPSGFVVINKGSAANPESSPDVLSWIELSGISDSDLIYVLEAPTLAGSYVFAGEYGISSSEIVQIAGESNLVVETTTVSTSGTGSGGGGGGGGSGSSSGDSSSEGGNNLPFAGIAGSCVERWSCSDWTECVNGSRQRVCAETTSCGTENAKPKEVDSCGLFSLANFGSESSGGSVLIGVVLVFAVVLIAFLVFLLFVKKHEKSKNHRL